jgi:hypothetical protein
MGTMGKKLVEGLDERHFEFYYGKKLGKGGDEYSLHYSPNRQLKIAAIHISRKQ